MGSLLTTISLALSLLGGYVTQEEPVPVRIRIKHADPWLILALLEGQRPVSPELSTILGFTGLGQGQGPGQAQGPGQGQQGQGSLLPPGRLFINPTDNSIWFIPERK